jgi:hypothetical protein
MSYSVTVLKLVVAGVLFGCRVPSHNDGASEIKDDYEIELLTTSIDEQLLRKPQRGILIDSIFNSINLRDLKEELGDMTSTFLSDKYSSIYKIPDSTDGYFGKYFFPNHELSREVPILVTAVIFSNELPWRSSSKHETLIEFTCYNNNYLLNDLKIIGNNPDSLLQKFENYEMISSEWHLYYDDGGLVKLLVRTTDSTGIAKSYRIGKYNDVEIETIIETIKDSW